jgi:uncharacterized membrane protein
MHSLILPAVYVLSWSALPCIDKVVLRQVKPRVMLMATFILSTLSITALQLLYSFINADEGGARGLLGDVKAAVSLPRMWVIAALTATGYASYVLMLETLDVHRVALMVPLVLMGTLAFSCVFLKERLSACQYLGVAIIMVGLTAFYWQEILA